ncbi:unnamed protein product [Closterium sp. Naga37s-1]|nr:unnamed protein product [Closterium sp. Naga37s-1]
MAPLGVENKELIALAVNNNSYSLNAFPLINISILLPIASSPLPLSPCFMAIHRPRSQPNNTPSHGQCWSPSLLCLPPELIGLLIALSVNDGNDPTLAEAGSHWSRLLFISASFPHPHTADLLTPFLALHLFLPCASFPHPHTADLLTPFLALHLFLPW